MGMADVRHGRPAPPQAGAVQVSGLFRDRYPEMVRLADLLGADDPEDVAQEAFARLIRMAGSLRDPAAAVGYVRSTVCNLVRNRHRHLRVARLRTPKGHDEVSSEHAVMVREDHRLLLAALAALAALPARMPDGHEYGGSTVKGWPGSGVRLWVNATCPTAVSPRTRS